MGSPRPRSPNGHPYAIGPSSLSGGLRGRRSGLKSRSFQLLAIRFGWVVLVIWYEFFSSLSSCKFPDAELLRRQVPSGSSVRPTHVVLLADPHVPHPRMSYPPDSRPWVNFLEQGMDELFMRKSWNVVMRLGRVDAVIVLGDMLDWGRGAMSDAEYEAYYDIFHSIFRMPESIPMYFVPGNHDLPLGPNRLFSPHARDRYARHFSPPNVILPIANHSLILLDAVGLVEEDYRRYAAEMQFGEWDGVEGGVIEFVKGLGDNPPPSPRILISHIPLARAEAAKCGPLRERGRILKGAGPGYQNLLGSETSRFLLEVLGPSVVFSGDDHDYCDHTHANGVREVTVKSFSSSAGIKRPGFQLLSLVPPTNPIHPSHADRPCFLPDQMGVYYRVYLPLAIVTVLYLLGTNIRSAYKRWKVGQPAELKGRLSPAFPEVESMPTALSSARRVTERPVPLTLPNHPRSARFSFGMDHLSVTRATASAPVSPHESPRMAHSDDWPYRQDDDESVIETPNLSRRSSYIYMNGPSDYQTPAASSFAQEPSSYFLPIPSSSGAGLGLTTPGLSSTTLSGSMRRISSSNLSAFASSTGGGGSNPPQTIRRVTMPRMASGNISAKDKSTFGYISEVIPTRRGHIQRLRSFLRWLWKTRDSVVVKSWREVGAVAWPAAVVWVLVNGLFFIS
ncbi:Metallo-dependent phosphatase-like protein [Naematelia encephala]|uniref:Metallo-dependent phosphatase-like protein n=1 Tax=Naematelia encephala TaxID=71784 RepID=A0A1Y2AQQ2_9TREE|nr:Metallo-dependent phosphatase-like protein [Naematelia encephala]